MSNFGLSCKPRPSDAGISNEFGYRDKYLEALYKALLAECRDMTKEDDWRRADVLEVGSGYGVSTCQISECLPEIRSVLGLDADPEIVDCAFDLHADEKVDFACANIEDISSFNLKWAGAFDWLFSTHSLLWAKEQTNILRNLMWCLKPGGRCFFAVPASKPPDVHSAATRVVNSTNWKKYFESIADEVADLTDENFNRLWFHHPQADRVYSALLEQVGYQVLHTSQIHFRYVFITEDEYKECLKEIFRKPIEIIQESKRATFIKELIKAATKKVKKTNNRKYVWSIHYVAVIAKRPD